MADPETWAAEHAAGVYDLTDCPECGNSWDGRFCEQCEFEFEGEDPDDYYHRMQED